jgi:hypothetical protein
MAKKVGGKTSGGKPAGVAKKGAKAGSKGAKKTAKTGSQPTKPDFVNKKSDLKSDREGR